MISEEQYEAAKKQNEESQETINQYHREKEDRFQERLKTGGPFTDDELRYSASSRCPCGAGLAYPKDCSPVHFWDCSAILKGEAQDDGTHCPQYPFNMYSIKSEDQPSANGATTRPD